MNWALIFVEALNINSSSRSSSRLRLTLGKFSSNRVTLKIAQKSKSYLAVVRVQPMEKIIEKQF